VSVKMNFSWKKRSQENGARSNRGNIPLKSRGQNQMSFANRPSRRIRNQGEEGQYMVEMGLTLGYYVFVFIGVISVILAGYNFNSIQRGAWEAARGCAIGGTDKEVRRILANQVAGHYFNTAVLFVNMDSVSVYPHEDSRVDGVLCTVKMVYKVGINAGIFGNVVGQYTLTSTLPVNTDNDDDRDGLNDKNGGDLFIDDHDNDMVPDTAGTDADGDGIPDDDDSGWIRRSSAGVFIYSAQAGLGSDAYHNLPEPVDGSSGDSEQRFLVPLIYQREVQDISLFPMMTPARVSSDPGIPPGKTVGEWDVPPAPAHVAGDFMVQVDLKYDRDNDGWEDRVDEAAGDPTLH